MKSYFCLDFLIYAGRWIFSAFVMMIPLYIINKYNITKQLKYKEYIDLIMIQIIGAFVFWYIDQWIFKDI